MKKIILSIIIIVVFALDSTYLFKEILSLREKNSSLYDEIKEKQLLDINGNIKLKELSTKTSLLKNEVETMFNTQDQTKYHKLIVEKKNSNNNLSNEIKTLSNQVEDLENQKKDLNNQYTILSNKYKQLYAAKMTINNSSNKIKLINQYPKYPTGCESVALTMLLSYYGINTTPDTIISKLNKEPLPYVENNITYGGNPEIGFLGNPYSYASYGVYEQPLANVANSFKAGIQIRNNFDFQEVLNIVKNGTPVLVWTSMNLSIPYISNSWIYKPTGETIYWRAGEHAVVITEYQGNNVVIADPIGGKLKTFSAEIFRDRYNYYGKRALFYQ